MPLRVNVGPSGDLFFINHLAGGDSLLVPASALLIGWSVLGPAVDRHGLAVRRPNATGAPGVVLERTDHEQDARSLEARAKLGEPEALDRVMRAELPRVERMLIRLLGPRADLEDLIQTVFLEACRALPGFRGESKLSTFIGGIAVRVARRAMRPSAWWRRRGPMPEDTPDLEPDPEENAYASEQLRRARRVLDKIAAKKRVAFLLWALDGMSIEEIAATTGASVAATRSRIFYARKELEKSAARDPYLRGLLGGERT